MLKRIAIFYVTTFIFTILLAGVQQATGIGGAEFILPQWGPGLAALLMLLVFRKDGLNLRPVLRDAGWSRAILALALPLLGAAALFLPVGRLVVPIDAASALRALTPVWLAGMLFGALGEEIGWRGYLQPHLRERRSAWATSLLVGPLWALWHMQSWANGPLYMVYLILAMTGYSLVITALIDDAPGGRVALATLFHLGLNVGNVLYFDILGDTAFMLINAIGWLLFAALTVFRRRDLFFGRERALSDEPFAADGGSEIITHPS